MSQAITFKIDSVDRFSKRLFDYISQEIRAVPPISPDDLVLKSREVNMTKVHMAPYRVDAMFTTSVGLIHHEQATGTMCILDDSGAELREDLAKILITRKNHLVPLGESGANVGEVGLRMSDADVQHVAREKVRARHTRTVKYVGGNNHRYTKECVPSTRDVQMLEGTTVLLPVVTAKYELLGIERSIEIVDPVSAEFNILSELVCDSCSSINDLQLCSHCGKVVCQKDGLFGPKGHGAACSLCSETTCMSCGKLTRMALLFKKPVCSGCANKIMEGGKKVATWSKGQ